MTITKQVPDKENLIRELDEQKGMYPVVVLAVGFDAYTEFVFAGDPNGLEKLNRWTKDGGQPMGLIGKAENGIFHASLFAHYSDEVLNTVFDRLDDRLHRDKLWAAKPEQTTVNQSAAIPTVTLNELERKRVMSYAVRRLSACLERYKNVTKWVN